MNSKDRIEYVRSLIKSWGRISVSELSKQTSVSEETIRRDLDALESEGCITRVYGGAQWNENTPAVMKLADKEVENLDEKKKIALLLNQFVDGRMSLLADASTTCAEALYAMRDKKDLTVVTNSALIFRKVSDLNYDLISTGGTFNPRTMSFQGEIARKNLSSYHADLALFSCQGVTRSGGVYDSNDGEIDMKRKLIANAGKSALLADHTKFDHSDFLLFLKTEDLDYIFTDERPSDEWIDFCKEHQIELIF